MRKREIIGKTGKLYKNLWLLKITTEHFRTIKCDDVNIVKITLHLC